MNRRWLDVRISSVLMAIITISACGRSEPRSAIVQTVQQAGSGDLSKTSTTAMQQWLAARRDLAIQVEGMCKPVREQAPAEWADTTEGRLCGASRQLTFFRSGPVTGDGKTYLPGQK
jgi:hypothetical protein